MTGKIRILSFAGIAEKIGKCAEIPIPGSLPVAELRQLLIERYPECGELIRTCLIAVNQEYAGDDTQVAGQDEVALIPFVSGG